METWDILKQVVRYFADRRRRWLLPIVILLVIIGTLIIIGSSASIAPFIYTLF